MNKHTQAKDSIIKHPAQRLCRECKQPISKDARVCHHCNRNQNRFWLFVEKIGVLGSVIGVLVSVILVVLALLQFKEAHLERIKTEKLANEVKMVAQANAQLAALTITPAQGNSLEHQKRLIRIRDELLDILHKIGCEPTFISETKTNINEAIEYNLVRGLHQYVSDHYTRRWNDYQAVMYVQPRNYDNLRALFGAALKEDTQLSEHIDELERFSTEK